MTFRSLGYAATLGLLMTVGAEGAWVFDGTTGDDPSDWTSFRVEQQTINFSTPKANVNDGNYAGSGFNNGAGTLGNSWAIRSQGDDNPGDLNFGDIEGPTDEGNFYARGSSVNGDGAGFFARNVPALTQPSLGFRPLVDGTTEIILAIENASGVAWDSTISVAFDAAFQAAATGITDLAVSYYIGSTDVLANLPPITDPAWQSLSSLSASSSSFSSGNLSASFVDTVDPGQFLFLNFTVTGGDIGSPPWVSFDNITVRNPEPGSIAFGLIGLATGAQIYRRRRKHEAERDAANAAV